MNRRGFLASILALGVAPAIVRAESIMRVRPLVLPTAAELARYGGSIRSEIGFYENVRFIESPPLSSALVRKIVTVILDSEIPADKNGLYLAVVHPGVYHELVVIGEGGLDD